ncbi:hypothetical protein [Pseudomonas putida]|uniref:hypothetical protein n=1 Tax=Pseudomonas putida TaxID=303 RepID=UPI003905CCDD
MHPLAGKTEAQKSWLIEQGFQVQACICTDACWLQTMRFKGQRDIVLIYFQTAAAPLLSKAFNPAASIVETKKEPLFRTVPPVRNWHWR